MGNWQEVELSNLITIRHGYAFKGDFFSSEPTDNLLLTPGNFMMGGGFKADKFKYYKGNVPLEFILKEGDIIVTMTDLSQNGDTLGYAAKVPSFQNKRFLHNQRLGLVTVVSSSVESDYIYWVLRTKSYHHYIVASSTGSTVKHTSPSLIRGYSFALPSIEEQRGIVGILNTLDDKIDLLHRQNKTLEALAETLFRQWFVEEASDDWKKVKLAQLGKIICGKTPSKKIHSYFGGNTPFIKIPDMHKQIFLLSTEDSLTIEGVRSQTNKLIPPKSICVSCIATVGLVALTAFESQTNQQINSIIPYSDEHTYFLYLYFKSIKNELLAMASGGTATDNLNTGDFSNIEIQVPPSEVTSGFHSVVNPLFDKILSNQIQIRTLESLRDTLLPKLMSGEVRVQYNEQEETEQKNKAVHKQQELPFGEAIAAT